MKRAQRGGFLLGMIVGLLVGLVLALGVALMVTKVPLPFVNKVPTRSAEQDAAESEKNRSWDPNAPLSNRNSHASGPAVSASAPGAVAANPAASAANGGSKRDPAAILAGKLPGASSAASAASAPTALMIYYVQAGAFADPDEAEQQRARLAMMGMEARVTQRQQSGRTVYRVRVGSFDERPDAEAARDRLASAGIDAALVRVQK